NAEFDPGMFRSYVSEFKSNPDLDVRLLFLECDDETLQRRFTETRRRHPQALDRPVMDGISAERKLLEPIKEAADRVIDTSLLTVADLRRVLAGHYRTDNAGLTIAVSSFSYKYGVPREADLIFDVRFLKNPHWDVKLRQLTGRD